MSKEKNLKESSRFGSYRQNWSGTWILKKLLQIQKDEIVKEVQDTLDQAVWSKVMQGRWYWSGSSMRQEKNEMKLEQAVRSFYEKAVAPHLIRSVLYSIQAGENIRPLLLHKLLEAFGSGIDGLFQVAGL